MSALPILDLVAGIIFIYFLLAIVNNAIIEIISAYTKIRAQDLMLWLEQTFNKDANNKLADKIADHPLLSALSAKGKSTAYFNPKNFASALVQVIWAAHKANETSQELNIENLKSAISSSPALPDALKEMLIFEIDKISNTAAETGQQIQLLERRIEDWYNGIMERIGSRFKRKILKYTLLVSMCLALSLNVDTLSLASYFYRHPLESAAWAQQGYDSLKDSSYKAIVEQIALINPADSNAKHKADSLKTVINDQKQMAVSKLKVMQTGLPLGWNQEILDDLLLGSSGSKCYNILKKILGIAITVFAMAMGAPFWFDVLSKVANIRSVIKPTNK